MCPCLNLLSAFSVSVWLPDVRWLSNVSFISFLWFCSSLVRSVDSDCKWRQKEVQCLPVWELWEYRTDCQDLLQTQSRSVHSRFPGKILRNILFYEVGTRECSADKNIVLKRLTLKIVFFILMRKILIKSAKSGEFVKDRPCSSKWRVVTGHQCDVATM